MKFFIYLCRVECIQTQHHLDTCNCVLYALQRGLSPGNNKLSCNFLKEYKPRLVSYSNASSYLACPKLDHFELTVSYDFNFYGALLCLHTITVIKVSIYVVAKLRQFAIQCTNASKSSKTLLYSDYVTNIAFTSFCSHDTDDFFSRSCK